MTNKNQPVCCVDCAHYTRRVGRKLPGTASPPVFHECRASRDLVTGVATTNQCISMRGKSGGCGPKGLMFVEAVRALEAAE